VVSQGPVDGAASGVAARHGTEGCGRLTEPAADRPGSNKSCQGRSAQARAVRQHASGLTEMTCDGDCRDSGAGDARVLNDRAPCRREGESAAQTPCWSPAGCRPPDRCHRVVRSMRPMTTDLDIPTIDVTQITPATPVWSRPVPDYSVICITPWWVGEGCLVGSCVGAWRPRSRARRRS
jgi:hypothetical protein